MGKNRAQKNQLMLKLFGELLLLWVFAELSWV